MSLPSLILGVALLVAQDSAAEYQRLNREYEAAEDAYFQPAPSPRPVALDPQKHPRKEFLPRFEELAVKSKGSETGCQCWGWVFEHADDAPEARKRAQDALGSEYLPSPALEDIVPTLAWPAERAGHEQAEALLETILVGSPHAPVRAAVLFTQARAVVERGTASEAERTTAAARLARLQKEFGETDYATAAVGLMFELEHLQIGMIAPDFETIDEEGKPWKLSDYRGKVVVLEFWGFW